MSQDKQPERKLRNFLLLPNFQLKLIAHFVALFFLTTLSMYSISYLFFWRLTQKALNVGIPSGHVFFTFIENQKHDLDLFFIIIVVINFLLLLGTGIVVSHRIAGPLFELKRYLSDLGQHSIPFKLREKDFFLDLVSVVNSLKDKLK